MRSHLTLALGLLLATAGAAKAAPAWTGGDDLPTNPLSCDATPTPAASAPYNGGMAANAPNRKGKEINVVDVPKLIGVGYFNASSKGMSDAAKELGNVKVKTDGPTKANIDDQITFLDNYITSGVDGILFAANDPVAIASVLRKALSKGVMVVGYDADAQPDARQWFVNQAQFNGVAKVIIDALVEETGEDASFAIETSTFTTPNQARWISEMATYAQKCHPKLKWLETVEAQEDNILSFNQAMTLINKYGSDFKGILGMTNSPPTSCWDAPELWDGLKGLEQVGDAPQTAREPRRHAAQDVLRLLFRVSAFSGRGVVGGVPLSRGHGEVERQRHDQDQPGQPVRVADLAVFQAEAAGLEVGEHRLDAPAPRVVERGEVAWNFGHGDKPAQIAPRFRWALHGRGPG